MGLIHATLLHARVHSSTWSCKNHFHWWFPTVWLAKHLIKGASKYFFYLARNSPFSTFVFFYGPAIRCENSFVFNEELIGRWLQGLTTRLLMSQIPIMIIAALQGFLLASSLTKIENHLFSRDLLTTIVIDVIYSHSTVTSFIFFPTRMAWHSATPKDSTALHGFVLA